MVGGETYVKKIPSMKVIDIAKVIAPEAKHEIVGIRPGEKVHEQMIGQEDSFSTYEYSDYFKILPQINDWHESQMRIKDGIKVPTDFVYASGNNTEWMTGKQLRDWIDQNAAKIGTI
jgi:FlaA1/EpsC-like NDP-sugar epimerase